MSLILLIIPLIGYRSIQDLEDYLRHNQERSLLEYARLITEAIKHNNINFDHPVTKNLSTEEKHLYIRALNSPAQLDGYATGDWALYKERTQQFRMKTADDNNPDPLSFKMQAGHYNRYLYFFIQVNDKHIIYRQPNNDKIDQNDHVIIGLENGKKKLSKYILSSFSPGLLSAERITTTGSEEIAHVTDERINAVWLENDKGYNVEIRIPVSMIGQRIAISVADVDNASDRKIANILNISSTEEPETTNTISVAPHETEQYLMRLARRSTRIWVTDNKARVLALSGDLLNNEIGEEISADNFEITVGEVVTGIIRLFYQLLLKQPADQFQDDLSIASTLSGKEIESALNGIAATQWRQTPDKQLNILTAAYPLLVDGIPTGIVTVEETSNSILILQNRAFEILINLSVLAFIIATSTLLFFASRLTIRIRRLRDESANAISEDGRVEGTINSSSSRDEIGDLTRTMSDMLVRLSQYNKYLETMASKLTHELRTPITVVKSSLENLEQADTKDAITTYTQRALDGVERLGNILTRMSEATRLEQTLKNEVRQDYDLEQVIRSCIESYKTTFPNQQYILTVEKNPADKVLTVNGAPDLLAQLMDKLLSNANDFSLKGKPIEITLANRNDKVVISLANYGPGLPPVIRTNLFESMVSSREKRDSEPHMGLGLYIVRLITEFHHGQVSAENRPDEQGVVFKIALPLN